jgi:oligoribonuclease NrnB/cAMP/cGMP phosphodiesterase (DHH superfamily)
MIPKFVSGSSPFHTMKFAIIYHDADFDGKLSNEVCRYWLNRLHPNATIHSYGWDYGRPVPDENARTHRITVEGGSANTTYEWTDYDAIYIVDLSVDELMARTDLDEKIIWIDHHKSAIEKWDNPLVERLVIMGYRIDGVAACRLCWQWFVNSAGYLGVLPSKQDFIDRNVQEPALIRLAGEYDIWDHRNPNGKFLQFGLRSIDDAEFRELLMAQFSGLDDNHLAAVIETGVSIKSYCDKMADEYSAAYAHTIKWNGLTFCVLNIGQRGNSDLLRGGIKPEHDACFAWRFDGKQVMVSLYHIEGKTHHDLSLIAVKYKGGGHKGACGFRVPLGKLEEILNGGAV